MFSEFLFAEPSSATVDVSKLPHKEIFGFDDADGTVSLDAFGKKYFQRMKIFGYLTGTYSRHWIELMKGIQSQNPSVSAVQMHFYYEDSALYFFEVTRGEVNLWYGEGDMHYFLNEDFVYRYVGKEHWPDIYSPNNTFVEEDKHTEERVSRVCVHLPTYKSYIAHEGKFSFKRIPLLLDSSSSSSSGSSLYEFLSR